MHTTPISGAANALNASPAHSANSSLADFLLAGASGDSGLDFRTIAATLFGVADLPAGEQAQAKDSKPVKENAAGVNGSESEARKGKKPSDPASLLVAHPELTAPVLVPEAIIQAPPKPDDLKKEKEPSPLGVQASGGPQQETIVLPGKPRIASDEAAAMLAVNERATARPETMPTEGSLPEASHLAPQALPGGEIGILNGTPPDTDERIDRPVDNILQRAGKSAAEVVNASVLGAAEKKPLDLAKVAGGRSQDPGLAVPTKHGSAPTTSPDATAATGKSDLPRPAAVDSVPLVPPPAQPSNPQAKEIVERQVAARAASQAHDLSPALSAESRNTAERTPASELSKIKDRNGSNGKDRIGKDRGKDSRAASGDSAKIAATPAGRAMAGTTNPGGNKDGGMGSPNNSAAQARQGLVKPSAGIAQPTAALDTDGPDEALPVTTSSPITAKFVQGMSGSEFRVGMQSQEFGNIDIRTSVARHMFSAQISVEHSDVAKSLATELPALYSKLADQHVPVANIVIQGQGLASSSGFASDAQQPQTWRTQQSNEGTNSNAGTILPVMAEALDSDGRLDIRI